MGPAHSGMPNTLVALFLKRNFLSDFMWGILSKIMNVTKNIKGGGAKMAA